MREVLLLSHELRTPLSVIAGYLEILDEHEFSPAERKEIRGRIRAAVHELEGTIQLLIDRERRVALAYGFDMPDLIDPLLRRPAAGRRSARVSARQSPDGRPRHG